MDGRLKTMIPGRFAARCVGLLMLLAGIASAPAAQAPMGGGMRGQGGGQGGGQLPPGTAQRGGQFPQQQMQARMNAGIETLSYQFEPTGERLEFALFVPRKIKKAKEPKAPAPLIVALHALNTGPAMLVNDLATTADRLGYIVVGPSGYRLDGWFGFQTPGASGNDRRKIEFSEQGVLNVLDIVRAKYNIEENRIYLAGMSMGATGALYLGRKYPEKWAAIAAMAPGVPDAGAGFEVMSRVPLMFMIGDRDELLPIDGTRKAVNRLREAGVSIQYIEIKGGGHAAPIRSGPPEVFKFFEKHKVRAAGP
jgi:predicted peptidase